MRGEVVEAPEHRQVGDLRATVARVLVDEAEEPDAVLGVMLDLPRDKLADIASPDNDAVLRVDVHLAHDRACEHPPDRDEDQREEPEGDETVDLRMDELRHPAGDEDEPGAERDEREHAERLVGGRVVGARVVELVQAEALREQDPDGQRDEEEQELEAQRHMLADGRAGEEGGRDDEGDREAAEVGEGERSANVPAPAARTPPRRRFLG